MTRQAKKGTSPRGDKVRRPGRWMIGVVLLAVVAVGGYWIWGTNAAAPRRAPSEQPGQSPSKLIGSWLRTDGGYMLELGDATPDGLLKAAYFNPHSIHVSRAKWHRQDSGLGVFVELRDAGYPGSTYTLTYQQEKDQLVGTYHQAAIRQNFNVTFSRKK